MKRCSNQHCYISDSTKPCNPVQSFVCLSFVINNSALGKTLDQVVKNYLISNVNYIL